MLLTYHTIIHKASTIDTSILSFISNEKYLFSNTSIFFNTIDIINLFLYYYIIFYNSYYFYFCQHIFLLYLNQ